jgi:galactokinase
MHDFELERLPDVPVGSWVDYPLGVVRELVSYFPPDAGRGGLDLLFGGNLPIGAGLSSSASICVGTAVALDALWRLGLVPSQRVNAALVAEREFVGVKCGIMDPFAVGYARPGHLLWLDCKDESIEHLPLDPNRVRIAVVDTGVRRELAQSAFNERVAECRRAYEVLSVHMPEAQCLRDVPRALFEAHRGELEVSVARRARHVIDEVERTFAARDALKRNDLFRFGAQMSAAHRSLAEKFEVSVPELDCVVDTALDWEGVLGARLTGAGFGGCAVVLLVKDAREGFREWIASAFQRRFRRAPTVRFFEGDPGPRELTE